jgi:hypothetical protein
MNSLPIISHRLFVAAIANEGQERERPRRPEKTSGDVRDPAAILALAAADRPTSIYDGFRPLQGVVSQARA